MNENIVHCSELDAKDDRYMHGHQYTSIHYNSRCLFSRTIHAHIGIYLRYFSFATVHRKTYHIIKLFDQCKSGTNFRHRLKSKKWPYFFQSRYNNQTTPDMKIELSLTFSNRQLNNTNADQSAVTLLCNIFQKMLHSTTLIRVAITPEPSTVTVNKRSVRSNSEHAYCLHPPPYKSS